MKRSLRFRLLLRLEEAKEREEAMRFADQQRALYDKMRKLGELESYLREYQQRFADIGRGGMPVAQLRASHAFIGQLDEAISQQHRTVADAERNVEEYRQYWLAAKRRVDILQKTMEKMLDEELAQDRRREQALSDEAARRKFHQPQE